MKEVLIEAVSRTKSGKEVARKLRAAQKIPAVVYGKDQKPIALEIDYQHFHTIYHGLHGENVLVNLKIDGKLSDKKSLIRDIQYDPVFGNIIHIDFQNISMEQKIHLSVLVRLHGTAIGVKSYGGILQWSLRELEVSCLPDSIPEAIDINIDNLNIHDSIRVKDIDLPGIEFLDDPDKTIVNVIPPVLVKETVTETAEEGEIAPEEAKIDEEAEPEVISEKKTEERKTEKGKKE
ncbi:MAG: hypothetical protein B6D58_06120 [candidate division Zixibacteria bacterium 4484_95]|nr:MAG: hypothetical protein B6D58_06120 [candidate division Zixibacteria bacterium 4484_95]